MGVFGGFERKWVAPPPFFGLDREHSPNPLLRGRRQQARLHVAWLVFISGREWGMLLSPHAGQSRAIY